VDNTSDTIRRIKEAEKNWDLWRSLHQEAMDYAAPNRETFNEYSGGMRKNRHIYDSTAVIGTQQFANRIQGSVIPAWSEWMEFTAGDEIEEDKAVEANQLLESVTKKFFSVLNHSNFYTELAPSLTDLAIGTGAILIEENEFGKDDPVRFTNVPLAELYPEKPPAGSIDSVWRKQMMKPCHIKRVWPEAKLTGQLEKLAEKPDSKEVTIWNGQCYNADTGMYDHKVMYLAENAELFSQSFKTKRLIVFRWHVTPGEVFGRGPIIQMLPDIRTANIIREYMLRNAAIQMSGIYTGVTDGIFNPHTVRIAPGSIIPVASNSNQNPSLTPLTPSGNIGLGDAMLEQTQDIIRRALFADPMGELTDPVRSATEMMIRQQEMLKDAGASFGRLKTELIEPLVSAVMDILSGLGQVPDIKIDGKEVTIRQQSPLAKSEALEDFQNIQVWAADLAGFVPEEAIMGSVKIEDYPKITAEKLGIPPELIRNDAERAQVAQAAQAAAEDLGGGQPTE